MKLFAQHGAQEGEKIKVRFEGYRFREAIITKAMVSGEE